MREPVILPEANNEKVPQAQHPFYHMVEIQTRFNDFDMLGHLNNSVYLQFMDLAKVRYFEAALGHPLDMHGPGVVVVNINVSFFSPAYISEKLAVATACVKISQRSFILEQRVLNPESGRNSTPNGQKPYADLKAEALLAISIKNVNFATMRTAQAPFRPHSSWTSNNLCAKYLKPRVTQYATYPTPPTTTVPWH